PCQTIHLERLKQALLIERSIDFNKVEKERTKLISDFAKLARSAEMSEILAASTLLKTGKISAISYYEFLKKICNERKINMARFPMLNQYIEYLSKIENIDHTAVFRELVDHQNKIEQALCRTKEQKLIVILQKSVFLLRKLSEHALTEGQWNQLQSLKPEILKILAEVPAVYSSLPSSWNDMLDRWKFFESFYTSAIKRNTSMANNFTTAANKSKISILVVGGFHSSEMKDILIKNGFNVLIASPKITHVLTKGPSSLDYLVRNHLPLNQVFVGEKLFIPTPMVTAWSPLSKTRAFELMRACYDFLIKISSPAQNEITRVINRLKITLSTKPPFKKSSALTIPINIEDKPNFLTVSSKDVYMGWPRFVASTIIIGALGYVVRPTFFLTVNDFLYWGIIGGTFLSMVAIKEFTHLLGARYEVKNEINAFKEVIRSLRERNIPIPSLSPKQKRDYIESSPYVGDQKVRALFLENNPSFNEPPPLAEDLSTIDLALFLYDGGVMSWRHFVQVYERKMEVKLPYWNLKSLAVKNTSGSSRIIWMGELAFFLMGTMALFTLSIVQKNYLFLWLILPLALITILNNQTITTLRSHISSDKELQSIDVIPSLQVVSRLIYLVFIAAIGWAIDLSIAGFIWAYGLALAAIIIERVLQFLKADIVEGSDNSKWQWSYLFTSMNTVQSWMSVLLGQAVFWFISSIGIGMIVFGQFGTLEPVAPRMIVWGVITLLAFLPFTSFIGESVRDFRNEISAYFQKPLLLKKDTDETAHHDGLMPSFQTQPVEEAPFLQLGGFSRAVDKILDETLSLIRVHGPELDRNIPAGQSAKYFISIERFLQVSEKMNQSELIAFLSSVETAPSLFSILIEQLLNKIPKGKKATAFWKKVVPLFLEEARPSLGQALEIIVGHRPSEDDPLRAPADFEFTLLIGFILSNINRPDLYRFLSDPVVESNPLFAHWLKIAFNNVNLSWKLSTETTEAIVPLGRVIDDKLQLVVDLHADTISPPSPNPDHDENEKRFNELLLVIKRIQDLLNKTKEQAQKDVDKIVTKNPALNKLEVPDQTYTNLYIEQIALKIWQELNNYWTGHFHPSELLSSYVPIQQLIEGDEGLLIDLRGYAQFLANQHIRTQAIGVDMKDALIDAFLPSQERLEIKILREMFSYRPQTGSKTIENRLSALTGNSGRDFMSDVGAYPTQKIKLFEISKPEDNHPAQIEPDEVQVEVPEEEDDGYPDVFRSSPPPGKPASSDALGFETKSEAFEAAAKSLKNTIKLLTTIINNKQTPSVLQITQQVNDSLLHISVFLSRFNPPGKYFPIKDDEDERRKELTTLSNRLFEQLKKSAEYLSSINPPSQKETILREFLLWKAAEASPSIYNLLSDVVSPEILPVYDEPVALRNNVHFSLQKVLEAFLRIHSSISDPTYFVRALMPVILSSSAFFENVLIKMGYQLKSHNPWKNVLNQFGETHLNLKGITIDLKVIEGPSDLWGGKLFLTYKTGVSSYTIYTNKDAVKELMRDVAIIQAHDQTLSVIRNEETLKTLVLKNWLLHEIGEAVFGIEHHRLIEAGLGAIVDIQDSLGNEAFSIERQVAIFEELISEVSPLRAQFRSPIMANYHNESDLELSRYLTISDLIKTEVNKTQDPVFIHRTATVIHIKELIQSLKSTSKGKIVLPFIGFPSEIEDKITLALNSKDNQTSEAGLYLKQMMASGGLIFETLANYTEKIDVENFSRKNIIDMAILHYLLAKVKGHSSSFNGQIHILSSEKLIIQGNALSDFIIEIMIPIDIRLLSKDQQYQRDYLLFIQTHA
ncbi:MAG: hypothetical protein ACKVQC_03140, partial [Elusimicrobiota bacterium]